MRLEEEAATRSATEQIAIDAGMAVLGFILGTVLLFWMGDWKTPPIDEILTMGGIGILFIFGLRLVWRVAPDIVVFSFHPGALVGGLIYYAVKIGIAPLVGIVALPYAINRDIVLVVRERQAKQSAPTAHNSGIPGTTA